MDALGFRNGLCILRAIDRHELVEAGVIGPHDQIAWDKFREDPYMGFITCEEQARSDLWELMIKRGLKP